MGIIDEGNVSIQSLHSHWYKDKVAAMDMLRLDAIHPVVSGNKWYKLRLNMKHALENGFKTIVTFGGGFSNHLVATAVTAKMFDMESAGIIRGKYNALTPTLQACKDAGMQLIFVSQEDYKNKHETAWATKLAAHFDDVFIIPEGGANEWGRAGAGLIDRFISGSYTHVAVAVGTGTTLIGLRNKLEIQQHILGFVPMKQGAYLNGYISGHINEGCNQNWQLFDSWHFGGFGKWSNELIRFMNDFYSLHQIPLDIVYTSKMMYGIQQMVLNGFFSNDARILCIHSGGLQGNISVGTLLSF